MTHNAPKPNADAFAAYARPILRRISFALAGGTCAFALSLPLSAQKASAQGWQTIKRYDGNGWTETTRWINPEFGGIQDLDRHQATGNRCPMPAFEVVNPRRGEFRCVGYVAPWQ